jgi:4-hydroxy-3-methylbut-2-enyl diphosphate reductase
MSAVPDEIVTSDAATPVGSQETVTQVIPPAAEAKGTTSVGAAPAVVRQEPAGSAAGHAKAGAAAGVSKEPSGGSSTQSENQSDFESMFKELTEGDVVIGIVVHIDKDGVLVDVGSKSEGIIRPNELSKEPFDNIEDVVKVGDEVKVVVIGRDHEDGNLLLSKKRADFEKVWEKVIEALNDGTVLYAMVSERVKGGLVVDLGIRGFVPASHVGSGDFKHQNLDKYVGQSIPLKVIEVDRDRRKVVLSHRLATQEERENKKTQTLEALKEGDIRKGIVRRVTDYGAFIDLGGIDGLLHVSEMSWARIKHPSEVVRNGQELDVIILKLRLDQGRISLGLRQILPDPWTEIGDKYKVGDIIKAPVTRLVPFGAFVSLENGVEAIIPNSELSDRRISKPSDVVNPGDEVEARVIEVRPEERKMTLSIRRLVEAPAGTSREPFVPEPETGGGGRGRERERERPTEGRPEGGARPAAPRPERRRREGGRGREGGFAVEQEDDYKEYRNYRANQREETFGTSLADVLGDHFGALDKQEEAKAAAEAEPAAAEEATEE